MLAILPLEITCRFTTPALLPAFKGSTLRGAFGHALKKIACTLRQRQCDDCLLTANCAYSLIFATEKLRGSHIAARPHPYFFNPPSEEKREYREGDVLRFGLVLLGPAVEYLPHIIYALEMMGQSGLGKKGSNNGAGRYLLTDVSTGGQSLYNEQEKILHRAPDRILKLEEEPPALHLSVTLHTPLRVKAKNEFQRHITFPLLVRAALRRISSLEKSYSSTPSALDYAGLCRDAEKINLVNHNTHWKEYNRYSNRQKSSMLFGGVVGTLVFSGDLTPFLPLLRYGCTVNLGKQTAFGLGRIAMSTKE